MTSFQNLVVDHDKHGTKLIGHGGEGSIELELNQTSIAKMDKDFDVLASVAYFLGEMDGMVIAVGDHAQDFLKRDRVLI